jgi:hypothetical protein
METRVESMRYRLWLHKSEYSFFVPGIAPLDKRLGLTGNRVSPRVAHRLGWPAAALPQQAINFITTALRLRAYMDYAVRRSTGDPIGSGITEAGCKVIFNQRLKLSCMRWTKHDGRQIVDLRTACRSRVWNRIWSRGLDDFTTLYQTNSPRFTRQTHQTTPNKPTNEPETKAFSHHEPD